MFGRVSGGVIFLAGFGRCLSREVDGWGVLKADLHVHTVFSHDSRSRPVEVVEAAESRGLDAVAVTDHDSVTGSLAVMDVAEELGSDLLVIPGQEVSTPRGHLLVLGPEGSAPRGSVDEVVEWCHSVEGVCIAPHPFQRYRHGLGREVLSSREAVDAVEECNSRHLLPAGDVLSRRFASRYRYPAVGGSDAHVPEMVGRVYTSVEAEKELEGVLEAISEGRTEVRRGRTPAGPFVRQMFGTLWRGITR